MRCDTIRNDLWYGMCILHIHTRRDAHIAQNNRESPNEKSIYTYLFMPLSISDTRNWSCVNVNVRLVSIYQVCVRTHIGEFSFDYGKKTARKRKRVNNVQCNDQNEARMVVRGWEKDWWCGLFLSVVCRFFSFGHIISFTHAFRSVRSVSFSSSSPHRRFMKSYGKEKYFKVPLNTRCM